MNLALLVQFVPDIRLQDPPIAPRPVWLLAVSEPSSNRLIELLSPSLQSSLKSNLKRGLIRSCLE